MSEARGTFLNIPFYFCIYFQLRKFFITAFGLYLCGDLGATRSLRCLGARDGGVSCCRAQALGARASVVPALRLQDTGRGSF